MALVLSAGELSALSANIVRLGVFFRMATDPVIRLWLGIGDCEVGGNAYDTDASTYTGFGQLTAVPAVQQLINGVADRVTFTLSGVSSEVIQIASGEADSVKNVEVSLGICLFDANWQQLGVPKWLFRGRADFLAISQSADDNAITRSVELSVGTLFTSRRRRGLSYLTDYDQQRRSPGDKFCERTLLYSQEVEKVWPRF